MFRLSHGREGALGVRTTEQESLERVGERRRVGEAGKFSTSIRRGTDSAAGENGSCRGERAGYGRESDSDSSSTTEARSTQHGMAGDCLPSKCVFSSAIDPRLMSLIAVGKLTCAGSQDGTANSSLDGPNPSSRSLQAGAARL